MLKFATGIASMRAFAQSLRDSQLKKESLNSPFFLEKLVILLYFYQIKASANYELTRVPTGSPCNAR